MANTSRFPNGNNLRITKHNNKQIPGMAVWPTTRCIRPKNNMFLRRTAYPYKSINLSRTRYGISYGGNAKCQLPRIVK